MEREYQRNISAMGRAILGAFRSTPLGTIMAESRLAPAKPLPDSRQDRYAQRLMARLTDHGGSEEILAKRRSGAGERVAPRQRQLQDATRLYGHV